MNKFSSNYQLTDKDFQQIKNKVYQTIGVNLTDAKRALVVSRLSKRLRELGFDKFSKYFQYVDSNPQEADILFNLITTNVTNFFREKHHFDFLEHHYFPGLIRQGDKLSDNDSFNRLRIWSAACSSGEEPYSIAMTAKEYFDRYSNWKIQLLASDINLEVLRKAENGIYSKNEIKGIPYSWLKKYFKLGTGPNEGKFKVKDNLKKIIQFKRINLNDNTYPIEDPLHIIFCRNVFIYFDSETQQRILNKFYRHLLPGGILFLGHSESIVRSEMLSGKWKSLGQTIYQKESDVNANS